MSLTQRQDVLVDAVLQHAAEQGWDVVHIDRMLGRVEAVAPLETDGVFSSRERWTFALADGHVTVFRRYEARFGKDAAWEFSEGVCPGYTYAAELAQLRGVANALGRRVQLAHR